MAYSVDSLHLAAGTITNLVVVDYWIGNGIVGIRFRIKGDLTLQTLFTVLK